MSAAVSIVCAAAILVTPAPFAAKLLLLTFLTAVAATCLVTRIIEAQSVLPAQFDRDAETLEMFRRFNAERARDELDRDDLLALAVVCDVIRPHATVTPLPLPLRVVPTQRPAGRPGRAEYALVRASLRIARIVDDHASVATLTELKLVEPFHDPRLDDVTSDGAA